MLSWLAAPAACQDFGNICRNCFPANCQTKLHMTDASLNAVICNCRYMFAGAHAEQSNQIVHLRAKTYQSAAAENSTVQQPTMLMRRMSCNRLVVLFPLQDEAVAIGAAVMAAQKTANQASAHFRHCEQNPHHSVRFSGCQRAGA